VGRWGKAAEGRETSIKTKMISSRGRGVRGRKGKGSKKQDFAKSGKKGTIAARMLFFEERHVRLKGIF